MKVFSGERRQELQEKLKETRSRVIEENSKLRAGRVKKKITQMLAVNFFLLDSGIAARLQCSVYMRHKWKQAQLSRLHQQLQEAQETVEAKRMENH